MSLRQSQILWLREQGITHRYYGSSCKLILFTATSSGMGYPHENTPKIEERLWMLTGDAERRLRYLLKIRELGDNFERICGLEYCDHPGSAPFPIRFGATHLSTAQDWFSQKSGLFHPFGFERLANFLPFVLPTELTLYDLEDCPSDAMIALEWLEEHGYEPLALLVKKIMHDRGYLTQPFAPPADPELLKEIEQLKLFHVKVKLYEPPRARRKDSDPVEGEDIIF